MTGPGQAPSPGRPGLAAERTSLAWLRTTLSFVVSTLVLLRLLSHRSPLLTAACAACTLPLAAAVTWYALRRHQHHERAARTDHPLPDGKLPAAITALAMLLGTTGCLYVIVS